MQVPVTQVWSQDYKLVWEENFNSMKLDSSIWNIEENGSGGGNNELQYYHKSSIGIENVSGRTCLVLTAKSQKFASKDFTSGRVNSKAKLEFKYGKIEAMIKLPHTANGLWPAFWLLGSTIDVDGWPKCGEIDILEMGHHTGIKNGTQAALFNGACHWGDDFKNGKYQNFVEFSTADSSIQEDFHLFTLIWNTDSILMFLDQDKNPKVKPYYHLAITGSDSLQSPKNYFNKRYFILFNLAIGGNYTEIWSTDKITALQQGDAKMCVDFVKVYQINKDINIRHDE